MNNHVHIYVHVSFHLFRMNHQEYNCQVTWQLNVLLKSELSNCFLSFFYFFYSYVHTILFGSFLPPSPATSLFSHPLPLPRYQAETIWPLSLILLKREYKQ
jgi:hypothetical protein